MRSHLRKLALAASVAVIFLTSHQANAASMNPHCTDVGGAILTNLTSQTSTLGTATGDLAGGLGVDILKVNSDFTVFTVQHRWVTATGEALQLDQTDATGTYVGPGLFAFTDYSAHLSGGTGRFAGATGTLKFIGELDLNSGHVILRYSGQVCYGPSN